VELAVVSDCPLAALQLEKTTGRKAVHPILLLRDAYRAAEASAKPGGKKEN
jgi:Fe-S oxidoreductase